MSQKAVFLLAIGDMPSVRLYGDKLCSDRAGWRPILEAHIHLIKHTRQVKKHNHEGMEVHVRDS